MVPVCKAGSFRAALSHAMVVGAQKGAVQWLYAHRSSCHLAIFVERCFVKGHQNTSAETRHKSLRQPDNRRLCRPGKLADRLLVRVEKLRLRSLPSSPSSRPYPQLSRQSKNPKSPNIPPELWGEKGALGSSVEKPWISGHVVSRTSDSLGCKVYGRGQREQLKLMRPQGREHWCGMIYRPGEGAQRTENQSC